MFPIFSIEQLEIAERQAYANILRMRKCNRLMQIHFLKNQQVTLFGLQQGSQHDEKLQLFLFTNKRFIHC